MTRILFLTQVLPYPMDAGPKVRAHYVLRYLAQRHEITLVSFVRPDDKPEYVEALQALCREVHTVPMVRSRTRDAQAMLKAAVSRAPVVLMRDQIAAMYALIRALIQRQPYDAIHADQTSMAQYGEFAREFATQLWPETLVQLVLDAHNALYRVFEQMAEGATNPLRRLALRREASALQRYETSAYGRFDRTVFVTDEDRVSLMGADAERMGHTIPICVEANGNGITLAERPHRVTHLGTMFWPPNVEGVLWFGQEVMPLVANRVPEAHLTVIGKRPPRQVSELAAQPNVEVLGYVADPAPYLAETAAFIVPLHAGAGMRVKILDAWCWGLPVVSTTHGAEGIEATHGEQLLLADDAPSFAEAVARLLTDGDLRTRLIRGGRRRVAERFDWRTRYTAWDEIYPGNDVG